MKTFDKNQIRTLDVTLVSQIIEMLDAYKNDSASMSILSAFETQYSEKEIICKLRQMETLYQFQSHLFVKVEICKGILSPTKNVITIKGEVPQGERELYSDFIIQK